VYNPLTRLCFDTEDPSITSLQLDACQTDTQQGALSISHAHNTLVVLTQPTSLFIANRAAYPLSHHGSTPTPISESLSPPKRPSLLDMVKVKSDPCIDLHRVRCNRRHKSYTERRCEQGFIVNAESSLRDVL